MSALQKRPKSKVLKKGYINTYSSLTPQEKRQIHYKTLYKRDNPGWDESMVYLSREMRKYLGARSRLLDVGCGNGNYLIDENRTNIYFAVGIDPDKGAVRKNRCLDKVIIGGVENIPFKAKSFDLVTSLWVMEHLAVPKKAIGEIFRVLKTGGFYIFVAPNYNFLPLRTVKCLEFVKLNRWLNKLLFGRQEKDIFRTHYRANTINEIRKIAHKFEIIELRTNYDPSYTSFDRLTYKLSSLVNKVFTTFGLGFMQAHIIGILRKK